MERERTVADLHGMGGVMPALITRYHVEAFREQVNDLALALVAPLRADDYDDLRHKHRSQASEARSRKFVAFILASDSYFSAGLLQPDRFFDEVETARAAHFL